MKKKTNNQEKDLWKLLNVCTMLFASISFFTTAEGMKDYFFNGNAAYAYLFSFGIQGTLIGLNLKLPKYIFTKSKLARNCIVALYSATVLWSSGFSFVYVANSVYAPVWMEDAQIGITSTYVTAKNKLEKATDQAFDQSISLLLQGIREMQNTASGNDESLTNAISTVSIDFNSIRGSFQDNAEMIMVIHNLEKLYNGESIGDLSMTMSILKQQKNTLSQDIISDKSQISSLEASIDKADNNVSELTTLRSKVPKKSDAHDTFTMEIQREQANAAKLTTQKENLENIINEKDNRIKDFNSMINLCQAQGSSTDQVLEDGLSKIIAELGTKEPDIDEINRLGDNIFSMITANINTDGDSSQYMISLNTYMSFQSSLTDLKNLRQIQDFLKQEDNVFLETDALVSSRPLPKDLESWKRTWNTKLSTLKNHNYSLLSIMEQNQANDETLKRTNSDISSLQRNWLMELNGIEKAIFYLVCDYPKLAWFSLILALYMDASPILIGFFKYYDKSNAAFEQRNKYKAAFAGSTLAMFFLVLLTVIR